MARSPTGDPHFFIEVGFDFETATILSVNVFPNLSRPAFVFEMIEQAILLEQFDEIPSANIRVVIVALASILRLD